VNNLCAHAPIRERGDNGLFAQAQGFVTAGRFYTRQQFLTRKHEDERTRRQETIFFNFGYFYSAST
jgi:hypothetical protein